MWRSGQCPLTLWIEGNLLGGTCASITSFGSWPPADSQGRASRARHQELRLEGVFSWCWVRETRSTRGMKNPCAVPPIKLRREAVADVQEWRGNWSAFGRKKIIFYQNHQLYSVISEHWKSDSSSSSLFFSFFPPWLPSGYLETVGMLWNKFPLVIDTALVSSHSPHSVLCLAISLYRIPWGDWHSTLESTPGDGRVGAEAG